MEKQHGGALLRRKRSHQYRRARGDELITRLEGKYYVLPDGKRPYAADQLVLVVPESLVEAPGRSTRSAERARAWLWLTGRERGSEPRRTRCFGLRSFRNHLRDVWMWATDSRGVIDHVLSGQADVGIIYGHEAVRQQQRLRVAGVVEKGYQPTVHSMAMERYCPNRTLCEEFLSTFRAPMVKTIVRQAGYTIPAGKR